MALEPARRAARRAREHHGGSFYWIRGFVLQGLRALSLAAEDFDKEAGQVDATTAHAIERAIGILTEEAGLTLVARDAMAEPDSGSWRRYNRSARRRPRLRVVPFYLPQFHPTPENDTWWGAGFTEWTNVTAARPVYEGQNQPNLPSDLGFYDLRLDAVREAQMDLAAKHGIEGFNHVGQRELDPPLGRANVRHPDGSGLRPRPGDHVHR